MVCAWTVYCDTASVCPLQVEQRRVILDTEQAVECPLDYIIILRRNTVTVQSCTHNYLNFGTMFRNLQGNAGREARGFVGTE